MKFDQLPPEKQAAHVRQLAATAAISEAAARPIVEKLWNDMQKTEKQPEEPK